MLRDETDLTRKRIYIGLVKRDQSRFARIEPLAVAFDDGWEEIENAKADFPDGGLVFNPDPTTVGQEGRIVLFTVRESESYAPGRDRYIAAEVDEPYEIRNEFLHLTSRDQRLPTAHPYEHWWTPTVILV